MMILFYLVEGLLFGVSGLLLLFKVNLVKKFLSWIQERDLFLIPGIIEIILGLSTLYFRHQTNLKTFVLIVGLMLFIDGIFYLTASTKLKKTYQWFLTLEDKSFKTYSLFMFLIALGLIASAVITV